MRDDAAMSAATGMGRGLLPLLRLLQLASPALPVGAYSYSQGLEHAVEAGVVRDEASAARWIEDVLCFGVGACEAPCLVAMMAAASSEDAKRLAYLNQWFLASRESAELRAETVQLGYSLARLLESLLGKDAPQAALIGSIAQPSYPCAWAGAACAFGLPRREALAAYLWTWLENQVLAAVKLVPLGQSAGQRMLLTMGDTVAQLAERQAGEPDEWINLAPGFALAAALHEAQYTRLFRS